MTTANNESRHICKAICKARGWKKDGKRNVIHTPLGTFCFSVSSDVPQCRQTYEDTDGFITLWNDRLYVWSKANYILADYPLSRISPSGVKSHSVIAKPNQLMEIV